MRKLTQAEKDAREEAKEMHACRHFARYEPRVFKSVIKSTSGVKWNSTWEKVFS